LWTIEKTQFVEGCFVIKAIEDGLKFNIAAEMIRFLLGFGRIESVRIIGARRDGDKSKYNKKEKEP
jgi:hypothetical protein